MRGEETEYHVGFLMLQYIKFIKQWQNKTDTKFKTKAPQEADHST